jgi:hypothetical protein
LCECILSKVNDDYSQAGNDGEDARNNNAQASEDVRESGADVRHEVLDRGSRPVGELERDEDVLHPVSDPKSHREGKGSRTHTLTMLAVIRATSSVVSRRDGAEGTVGRLCSELFAVWRASTMAAAAGAAASGAAFGFCAIAPVPIM